MALTSLANSEQCGVVHRSKQVWRPSQCNPMAKKRQFFSYSASLEIFTRRAVGMCCPLARCGLLLRGDTLLCYGEAGANRSDCPSMLNFGTVLRRCSCVLWRSTCFKTTLEMLTGMRLGHFLNFGKNFGRYLAKVRQLLALCQGRPALY